MKYCADCTHSVPDGADYCPSCGSDKLVVTSTNQEALAVPCCKKCGRPVRVWERFCPACGLRVEDIGRGADTGHLSRSSPPIELRPEDRESAKPMVSGPNRRRKIIVFATVLALCLGVGAWGYANSWWAVLWQQGVVKLFPTSAPPKRAPHAQATARQTPKPTRKSTPRPTAQPTSRQTNKPTRVPDEASEIYARGGQVSLREVGLKSNVRIGPGLAYEVMGVLSGGTNLEFLNETSVDGRGVTWYKVRFKGHDGWISEKYTKLKSH